MFMTVTLSQKVSVDFVQAWTMCLLLGRFRRSVENNIYIDQRPEPAVVPRIVPHGPESAQCLLLTRNRSLEVRIEVLMLLYLLPDGRRLKRWLAG